MFVFWSIIFIVWGFWYISTKRPKLYPPGPKWLPMVGNSLKLRKAVKEYGSQSAVFQAWRSKYKSDVLGLKLGSQLVVIGLSDEIIQHVQKSDVFNGRPDNFFTRLRTFETRLGVTFTDGEFWSEQRNFVVRHLRRSGYGRDLMEDQLKNESNALLQKIANLNEKPAWPAQLFSMSVLSVLWTFIAGDQLSPQDPYLLQLLELMRERSEAFDVSGGWLSAMPFLRFIAPEMTSYNLLKRFNEQIRNFLQPVIDDHKIRFDVDKVEEDLIFAFINEMKRAGDEPSNFTDAQLIMIVLDLFIAGANITVHALDFIMLMLVMHPDVQKKCKKEIDEVLGTAQLSSLKDKSKLSYVEATIFETLRICNIVAIGGIRRAMCDTMLGGYLVPKNTTVLLDLETVNLNPEIWGDPNTFRPERFLDENKKIINTDRLVVFGKGKRRCLGETLAKASLFMFTTQILQKFDVIVPPNGKQPEMEIVHGIFRSPAPYDVVFRQS